MKHAEQTRKKNENLPPLSKLYRFSVDGALDFINKELLRLNKSHAKYVRLGAHLYWQSSRLLLHIKSLEDNIEKHSLIEIDYYPESSDLFYSLLTVTIKKAFFEAKFVESIVLLEELFILYDGKPKRIKLRIGATNWYEDLRNNIYFLFKKNDNEKSPPSSKDTIRKMEAWILS